MAAEVKVCRGGEAYRFRRAIQPIPISFDYDRAKVELGKKLFFEPRLSKSGWITCNHVKPLDRRCRQSADLYRDINGSWPDKRLRIKDVSHAITVLVSGEIHIRNLEWQNHMTKIPLLSADIT
jgi:hypothetical protein